MQLSTVEIWKDIKGFEGFYQVSNLGRIRSLARKSKGRWGQKIFNGIVLQPVVSDRGYIKARLYKSGKGITIRVHRVVAEAFVPNPHNYAEVNHKNEIKTDNRSENLEWSDRKHNCQYGTRTKRQSEKLSCPIRQITKSGEVVREFISSKEAERLCGYSSSHINECCNGKRKTSNGYKWEFV